MSARGRATEAAGKLLGTTGVRAFAFGRAHARMTNGAWWLIAIFGAAFVVVLVALKTILIPGVVLVWILFGMVRPRRGVAVTGEGVTVMALSGWNGKPTRVIETLSSSALRTGIRGARGNKVDAQLGADLITLRRSDFAQLAAAIPADAVPPPHGAVLS